MRQRGGRETILTMAHKVVLVVVGAFFGWLMLGLVLDRDLVLVRVVNDGLTLMVTWLTFGTLSTALARGRPRDLLVYGFAVVVAFMTGIKSVRRAKRLAALDEAAEVRRRSRPAR